jgi:hypothetical protein
MDINFFVKFFLEKSYVSSWKLIIGASDMALDPIPTSIFKPRYIIPPI